MEPYDCWFIASVNRKYNNWFHVQCILVYCLHWFIFCTHICSWESSEHHYGTTDSDPNTTTPLMGNIRMCNHAEEPVGIGEVRTFPCTTMGRYVVIIRQKTNSTLTLCEVEVYGQSLGKHCIGNFYFTARVMVLSNTPNALKSFMPVWWQFTFGFST